MKTNRDKILEYIKEESAKDESISFTTMELAKVFRIQRANLSTALNQLVEQGELVKQNGRPVRYTLSQGALISKKDAFSHIVGWNGSLRNAIRLAKAGILYPENRLRILLMGEYGVGKRTFAKAMYNFAKENSIIDEDAPFVEYDCKDFQGDSKEAIESFLKSDDGANVIESAKNGVLFINHMELFENLARKSFQTLKDAYAHHNFKFIVICSVESENGNIHFSKEAIEGFPFQIHLPSLTERPLEERMEIVEQLLTKESAKVNREIVINSELLRCFLLYKCDGNINQLKNDIRIGCANAFVREVGKESKQLNIYLNDCHAYIRKAFLFYKENRVQIEKLIPDNYNYSFSSNYGTKKAEKSNLYKKETIYDIINEKAAELKQRDFSDEDIVTIISADLESDLASFTHNNDISQYDRSALEKIIDIKIVQEVDEFLKTASQKFNRVYSTIVFQSLCFHLDYVLKKDNRISRIDNEKISNVLLEHPDEYAFAAKFINKISKEFNEKLSIDDTVFFTLYLCDYQLQRNTRSNPQILIVMHGRIASAISEVVNALYKGSSVYSYDLLLDKDMNEVYEEIRDLCLSINNGQGLLVLYDMGSLKQILETVSLETSIKMRIVEMPVTLFALDAALKLDSGEPLDKVHENIISNGFGTFSTLKDEYIRLAKSNKRHIITLCKTGRAAIHMKSYLEKNMSATDLEIMPMSFNNRKVFLEEINGIRTVGEIVCIIGTIDPEIYDIPFIPVSQLFETSVDQLDILLLSEYKDKENRFDYSEMYDYLNEQLQFVNIHRLKKPLHKAINRMKRQIRRLEMDEEVGLFMHMACAINRIFSKQQDYTNIKKGTIISRHKKMYNDLIDILAPLEEEMEFKFSDEEIATILEILL